MKLFNATNGDLYCFPLHKTLLEQLMTQVCHEGECTTGPCRQPVSTAAVWLGGYLSSWCFNSSACVFFLLNLGWFGLILTNLVIFCNYPVLVWSIQKKVLDVINQALFSTGQNCMNKIVVITSIGLDATFSIMQFLKRHHKNMLQQSDSVFLLSILTVLPLQAALNYIQLITIIMPIMKICI